MDPVLLVATIAKILFVMVIILTFAPVMVWADRRQSAMIQVYVKLAGLDLFQNLREASWQDPRQAFRLDIEPHELPHLSLRREPPHQHPPVQRLQQSHQAEIRAQQLSSPFECYQRLQQQRGLRR